jgi:hypothetical protein
MVVFETLGQEPPAEVDASFRVERLGEKRGAKDVRSVLDATSGVCDDGQELIEELGAFELQLDFSRLRLMGLLVQSGAASHSSADLRVATRCRSETQPQ